MLDRVAHDEINLRQYLRADTVCRGISRGPGRGVDHGAEAVRNSAFQYRLQIGNELGTDPAGERQPEPERDPADGAAHRTGS